MGKGVSRTNENDINEVESLQKEQKQHEKKIMEDVIGSSDEDDEYIKELERSAKRSGINISENDDELIMINVESKSFTCNSSCDDEKRIMMMRINVNGNVYEIEVNKNTTVYKAINEICGCENKKDEKIFRLCADDELKPIAECGMCQIDVLIKNKVKEEEEPMFIFYERFSSCNVKLVDLLMKIINDDKIMIKKEYQNVLQMIKQLKDGRDVGNFICNVSNVIMFDTNSDYMGKVIINGKEQELKSLEEERKEILIKKLRNHRYECHTCTVGQDDCEFRKLLENHGLQTVGVSIGGSNLPNHQGMTLEEVQLQKKENLSVTFDSTKCVRCFKCIRCCSQKQNMCHFYKDLTPEEKKNVQFKGYKMGDIPQQQEIKEAGKLKGSNLPVFFDIEDFHELMYNHDCAKCGQCTLYCPTLAKQGALESTCDENVIKKILGICCKKDKKRCNIAFVAPSTRVIISDFLGVNAFSEGGLCYFLKSELRFDYVFDLNFAADLCAFEETIELIERISENSSKPIYDKTRTLPMFTSCCPSFVNVVINEYPHLVKNFSTCKSPQQMMGSIIKKVWMANKIKNEVGFDKKIVTLFALMPCTSKKDEMKRVCKGEIDYVITVRELGRLFKLQGFADSIRSGGYNVKNSDEYIEYIKKKRSKMVVQKEEMKKLWSFDDPLGLNREKKDANNLVIEPDITNFNGSGGGQIFGTSGGVTESALRILVDMFFQGMDITKNQFSSDKSDVNTRVNKNDCKSIRVFNVALRKLKGFKSRFVNMDKEQCYKDVLKPILSKESLEVKSAVVYSLKAIKVVMDSLSGKKTVLSDKIDVKELHFIEGMACPYGCLGGGGGVKFKFDDVKKLVHGSKYCNRANKISKLDEENDVRKSHFNSLLVDFYQIHDIDVRKLLHVDQKQLEKRVRETYHLKHHETLMTTSQNGKTEEFKLKEKSGWFDYEKQKDVHMKHKILSHFYGMIDNRKGRKSGIVELKTKRVKHDMH